MTFQEQVQRDAALDATNYVFSTLAEAMKVTDGIVFIYARWSGTAIQSWQTLTAILASFESQPRLFVVDADEFDPVLASGLIGELPQGKGETFWIKDGKTFAKLTGYDDMDTLLIAEHSKRLVK